MPTQMQTTTDDLPADQYQYATVQDLEFGDIEMPDDFEAEIHVVHPDGEKCLCGDNVGLRKVTEFEADQFDEHDYDAREWVEIREDACSECAEAFLDATADEEDE